MCCLQTAFPDAIEKVGRDFHDVQVLPIAIFDDDVRAFSAETNIFENEDERLYAKNVMLQIGWQLAPQIPLGFGDMAGLVSFHNTIPNNTLPVFWSAGTVNSREWVPLLPRHTFAS